MDTRRAFCWRIIGNIGGHVRRGGVGDDRRHHITANLCFPGINISVNYCFFDYRKAYIFQRAYVGIAEGMLKWRQGLCLPQAADTLPAQLVLAGPRCNTS